MSEENKSSLRSYQLAENITTEEVDDIFTYHKWNDKQIEDGQMVRDALGNAFYTIVNFVPPCPTRTRALNAIIDARMLANAAITFNGKY